MTDFNNIDNLLTAFYKCISGDNNSERDWNLHSSLYFLSAQLIILTEKSGRKEIEVKSADEYASLFKGYIGDRAFFEMQKSLRIDLLGLEWLYNTDKKE